MRQKQITNLEGFNLSVEQIEVMCQKYRDLGQVSNSDNISADDKIIFITIIVINYYLNDCSCHISFFSLLLFPFLLLYNCSIFVVRIISNVC